MKELIEISNYLLLNYWWIIIPVCALFGIAMTYVQMKFEKDEEKSNSEMIDEVSKSDIKK